MEELLESLTCPALPYADDVKLHTCVSSHADMGLLQGNLDAMEKWCRYRRLIIDLEKCMCITYIRKARGIASEFFIFQRPGFDV